MAGPVAPWPVATIARRRLYSAACMNAHFQHMVMRLKAVRLRNATGKGCWAEGQQAWHARLGSADTPCTGLHLPI